jgi:hypothetical protein
VEDRISGLKNKIDIKKKTEELLNKRKQKIQELERNTKELSKSIKSPNL